MLDLSRLSPLREELADLAEAPVPALEAQDPLGAESEDRAVQADRAALEDQAVLAVSSEVAESAPVPERERAQELLRSDRDPWRR